MIPIEFEPIDDEAPGFGATPTEAREVTGRSDMNGGFPDVEELGDVTGEPERTIRERPSGSPSDPMTPLGDVRFRDDPDRAGVLEREELR